MISNKLYYKAIAVKFWMEKEKYSFDSYYWCYVEVQDDPERVKEKTLNIFFAWSLIIIHMFQNMNYENKKSQEIVM